MKKIKNVMLDLSGYNCFGCSPNNKHGLKLEFYIDEENEEVYSYYEPNEYFAGFPGVLHGGIQALLIDEIAFWVMFGFLKKMGFTTNISVQYLRPLKVNDKIELRAKINEQNSKKVVLDCWLLNTAKKICTKASVEYVIVNKKLWQRNLEVKEIPETFQKYFKE